jgi:hypothetical protein
MERISWKDHVTNEAVLGIVGEHRCSVESIRNRKKEWIGHVVRGGGLLRDVIEGKMEKKRLRATKRLGMIDELYGDLYVAMKRN